MLFYRQDIASFLHAHVSYFRDVGGVAGELIYDNMRVAVAKFTRRNADKEPTEDLLKLSAYYGFSYRFCNVRRANEKGHVERSVKYVRRWCGQQGFQLDQLRTTLARLLERRPHLPLDPDAVRIALRAIRHGASGAQKDRCSASCTPDGQLIRQHAQRQLQQVQQLFHS